MEGDPFELVGDLIDGQFRVDSFVGYGDLSLVYRGFHLGVEADIAIKFLDLPTTLDTALVEPLIRSFREGSKLHYRLARGHLNIAQCIGSGQTLAPRTGVMVPYLVREWLQGQSLGIDLAERRLRGLTGRSLADTVDLFRGALEGLAYAHRQGVSHLALNPSNLFLARSGVEVRLKILDFGVAHALNEHAAPLRGAKRASPHQPGLRVLSPAYAAPEQLDAAIGQSGAWTDVYAMALLFIETLVDRPMFADAPPSLDHSIQAARPIRLPQGIDATLTAVLSRALSFSPRERQPSAGIFWKEMSEAVPARPAAPVLRRPSTAPKIPAGRVRQATLVGLQEEMKGKPPSLPPKRPSAPPLPMKKPSAPPPPQMKISTRPVPIQVPFAAKREETLAFDIDDAPTEQGPQIPKPPPMPFLVAPPPAPAPSWPTPPPIQQIPAPFEPLTSSRSAKTVAPPAFMSRKLGAVAVGVAGAIALLVLVVWIATRHPAARVAEKPIPTASATPQPIASAASPRPPAIPPIPPAPTTPIAPARMTSSTNEEPRAVATVAPATTTRHSTGRHRFTVAAGRAALNEAGQTLADCKRPHGHFGAGSVRVTFAPDTGRVIHVQIGPPYAGTDQGRCIVKQYRAAQVDPFVGRPSAINYVFQFPR